MEWITIITAALLGTFRQRYDNSLKIHEVKEPAIMAKDAKYILAIKTLCEADIRAGKRDKLESRLKECIANEDYETCEGIKLALNELK
jgi:hypothetical protein